MQRRDFISQGLLTLPVLPSAIPEWKGGLRVLFMTDMHFSPSIERSVRAAAFLENYINTQPVDLVINGGDTVYDVAKLRMPAGQEMWEMANSFFASLNKPVYHCIGNHDIYEWELHEQLDNAQRFKETVVKRLQMPARYYAFSKGAWKFIVLDSMTHRPKGYRGELDEEQAIWLGRELRDDLSNHIAVVSHIPIITACDTLYLPWEKRALYPSVAERLCHADAARIFEAAGDRVKLFLHGHLHMQEQIDYRQSRIYTCGAVCGDMWKGDFKGFRPGFQVLVLNDDGSTSFQQVEIPLA